MKGFHLFLLFLTLHPHLHNCATTTAATAANTAANTKINTNLQLGVAVVATVRLARDILEITADRFNNDVYFRRCLPVIGICSLMLLVPQIITIVKTTTIERCKIENLDDGFDRYTRNFVFNTFAAEDGSHFPKVKEYMPVLLTKENVTGSGLDYETTVIRMYKPDRPGQIVMMMQLADLPGHDTPEDGELMISMNCIPFSDKTDDPSKVAIHHLQKYMDHMVGKGKTWKGAVTYSMLLVNKDTTYCRYPDNEKTDTKEDHTDLYLSPKDKCKFPVPETEMDAWIDRTQELEMEDDENFCKGNDLDCVRHRVDEGRDQFHIESKAGAGVFGNKTTMWGGIVAIISVLGAVLAAFLPVFGYMGDGDGDTPNVLDSSNWMPVVYPGEPNGNALGVAIFMFHFTFFVVLIFAVLALVYQKGLSLSNFLRRRLNLRYKVIFTAIIYLMCCYVPLKAFYLASRHWFNDNGVKIVDIRGVHMMNIVIKWMSLIIATLLLANAFMLVGTDKFGWEFPVLFTREDAELMLAFETFIGAMFEFVEMVHDELAQSDGCDFRKLFAIAEDVLVHRGQDPEKADIKWACTHFPNSLRHFEEKLKAQGKQLTWLELARSQNTTHPSDDTYIVQEENAICTLTCEYEGQQGQPAPTLCQYLGLKGTHWQFESEPVLADRLCPFPDHNLSKAAALAQSETKPNQDQPNPNQDQTKPNQSPALTAAATTTTITTDNNNDDHEQQQRVVGLHNPTLSLKN